MQVGGVKYPVHPIGPQDEAQLYLNLVKAAGKLGSTLDSIGISLDEFLNVGGAKRKLFVLVECVCVSGQTFSCVHAFSGTHRPGQTVTKPAMCFM